MVPHLRRLARTTALVGFFVVGVPLVGNATGEGGDVLITLVLPLPVAATAAVLWTVVLRRFAVPDEPLKRLPAGREVSAKARPRWGTLLLASTAVTVGALIGLGVLSTGPGAAFGLLVNAYVVGGLLVGSSVGLLRMAAVLRRWERRNAVQVVTSAHLRGGSWVQRSSVEGAHSNSE